MTYTLVTTYRSHITFHVTTPKAHCHCGSVTLPAHHQWLQMSRIRPRWPQTSSGPWVSSFLCFFIVSFLLLLTNISFYFIFRCNDVTAPRRHTYYHNDDQHSTRPQPCEPLLARLIAGANSWQRRWGQNDDEEEASQHKKGPRDVVGCPLGPKVCFFFVLFIYFLLTETFRY